MRTKIFAWVLGMLLTMPCALRAEEVEIRLFVVLEMGSIDGLDPLDDSDPIGETPTTPTSFRASINGNQLDVSIEDTSISSAVMRVMRHSTNTTIIEQTIYDETTEYIPESGVYTLEIETAGGTLVGQFNVR